MPVSLLLGSILLFLFWIISGKLKGEHISRKVLLPVSLGLLLFQCFAISRYYFYTGWDVSWIMNLSSDIAHGNDLSLYTEYFSRYPNNLFLASVFAFIQKFMCLTGLHADEYLAVLFFQCVLSFLTGLILVSVLEKITKSAAVSLFGYLLYLSLVGISPWVSIPYSDSCGLLFPIMILWLYLLAKDGEKSLLCWVGVGIFTLLGYHIKPQTAIITIAILLMEAVGLFRKKITLRKLKRTGALAGGMLIGFLLVQTVISMIPLDLDQDQSFGIRHFLMMGMNTETMGIWSAEDVEYSASFVSEEERNEADLSEAVRRIEDMGFAGIGSQLAKKTLTNYYDGTFGWAGEGAFFLEVLPAEESSLSGLLRGMFYPASQKGGGKYYFFWKNFAQAVWMAVLFLGMFAVCSRQRGVAAVALGLIGLTLFELLFEARSRYLYTYLPLYIVMAAVGIQCLAAKRNARKQKMHAVGGRDTN